MHVVRLLGTSLKRVVLGFMLATAFLSMWISNTASTLLMLPIGLAMIASLRDLCLASDTSASPAGSQLPQETEKALRERLRKRRLQKLMQKAVEDLES